MIMLCFASQYTEADRLFWHQTAVQISCCYCVNIQSQYSNRGLNGLNIAASDEFLDVLALR